MSTERERMARLLYDVVAESNHGYVDDVTESWVRLDCVTVDGVVDFMALADVALGVEEDPTPSKVSNQSTRVVEIVWWKKILGRGLVVVPRALEEAADLSRGDVIRIVGKASGPDFIPRDVIDFDVDYEVSNVEEAWTLMSPPKLKDRAFLLKVHVPPRSLDKR